MDNRQRLWIRRILTSLSGFAFLFGLIAGSGIEFPWYNHYNPLYNPTVTIGFAFVLFVLRTYLKDKKETVTVAGFFDNTGLTDAYDVDKVNEDSTHIKVEDESGQIVSVKHSHPFLVPTGDGYERLYLIPRKGRVALDPKKLFQRYYTQFKSLSKEQFTKLFKMFQDLDTYLKSVNINELTSLNPDQLIKDMTESDDADTLMEEFTHHVSEIRKGFLGKLGIRENMFQLIMVGGFGAMIMLVLLVLGHADFSHVNLGGG